MRGWWCAACLLTMIAAPGSATSLVVLSEDNNPPLNYTDPVTKRFTGVSTDIVDAMMKRAGIDYAVTVLPWARAYKRTQIEANTCLYSTNRTPEREPLFKWVGPLVLGEWVLWAKAGSDIPALASLDEARRYTIGTSIGDALETYLQQQGGFQLQSVRTPELNVMKLEAGRIDLWATGAHVGPRMAHLEGGGTLRRVLTIRQSIIALACNLKLDDAIIKSLSAALATLKDDGTLQAIEARYD